MKIDSSFTRFRSFGVLLGASALFAASASAQTVWSDDYEGSTAGSPPTRDFPGGAAGNDYTVTNGAGTNTVVSGAISGNPGNSLVQTDTGTANATVVTVPMSQFAPFTLSETTNLLRVAYDFRVDSFLTSSTSSSTPRFILRFSNSANNQIILGFGEGNISDGDAATNDLALYAQVATGGTTNVTPSNTNAIGLIADTGWNAGFDFGDASATADDNDTSDQFYRFDFTYDFNGGAVNGTVTNLTTAASAPFSRMMASGLAFSNVAANSILFATGVIPTSTNYFDNVVIQAVPEPSTWTIMLGGIGSLIGFRRPRRRL